MTREELEGRYRAYIEALNEGRLQDAAQFYHERITLNGQPFGRDDFRDQVLAMGRHIAPDARVEIKSVVIDGDTLAARLVRTGTAEREWMGIKPVGHPVSFGEQAFYHLRDGQVDECWAIVDVAGLLAANAAS